MSSDENYQRWLKKTKEYKYWYEFYYNKYQKESKKLLKIKNLKTFMNHNSKLAWYYERMTDSYELYKTYKGWMSAYETVS